MPREFNVTKERRQNFQIKKNKAANKRKEAKKMKRKEILQRESKVNTVRSKSAC